MHGNLLRSWSVALLLSVLICPLGCEEADEDTSIPALEEFANVVLAGNRDPRAASPEEEEVSELTLSPGSATLENNGDMVSFQVGGGVPPYSWSVQDVFRGSIVDSGGSGAVYQRSAAGDNSVIVADSRGQKIYAVVNQP